MTRESAGEEEWVITGNGIALLAEFWPAEDSFEFSGCETVEEDESV